MDLLLSALEFVAQAAKEALLPYVGTFVSTEFIKLTAWLEVGNRRTQLKRFSTLAALTFSIIYKVADGQFSTTDATTLAFSVLSTLTTTGVAWLAATLNHKLSKAARGS